MGGNNTLVEQAIAGFARMPFDKDELYKRYGSEISMEAAKGAGAVGAREALKAVSDSAGLRFDLYSVGKEVKTSSGIVSVEQNAAADSASAKGAAFEDRLYSYMRSAGYNIIRIKVPDSASAKLNFLMLNENSGMQNVLLADVGENSSLGLFEWLGSAQDAVSTHAAINIVNAGAGSSVELSILHNESDSCDVGALNSITASDNATVKASTIYNGGRNTKSSTLASAEGQGSSISVNEIVLGNGSQSFDLGAYTLNSGTRTSTKLRSGAVLNDRALCTLKGYAKVASGAEGAYSYVEERGLVMGSGARMRPLPDMSIDCRNVAFASHSASAAPIDAEKLFYLMSRGIDEARAKRTFVAGFLSKYLANIANDTVKEIAISVLLDKLDNGRHATVPRISPQNLWIAPGAE